MKKVIRLTESDLVRIVNKVIKESGYRAKFKDQKDNNWVDEKNNWVDFDPDLEKTGYYDFDFDPYTFTPLAGEAPYATHSTSGVDGKL